VVPTFEFGAKPSSLYHNTATDIITASTTQYLTAAHKALMTSNTQQKDSPINARVMPQMGSFVQKRNNTFPD
jgi:hypothetical protein